MQLRYAATSPFVRKVMVIAIETGLVDRIETIAAPGSPLKPNRDGPAAAPLAKIPALLTDEGELLYDSPVICEYLDGLHDGARFFPRGKGRWQALRRQALGDGILDAAITVRYEMTLRPAELQWRDWCDAQAGKWRAALDALEAERLDDGFDIGHVTLACTLGYLDFRFPDEAWREARPRLAAWYESVAQRPSLLQTRPPG
ncbi:MAG: stress Response [Rhodospirillales bacterium]|nr:stress Response [Rhodospirillales bacterium]